MNEQTSRGGGVPAGGDPRPASASAEEAEIGAALGHVRALMESDRPHDAFQVLLHVLKAVHPRGEAGILDVLDTAKGLLTRQRQLDSVTEIDESLAMLRQVMERGSVLGDGGDVNILRDAFIDGSSVICKACGDLVKKERYEAHAKWWCPAAAASADDDDDDDDIDDG